MCTFVHAALYIQMLSIFYKHICSVGILAGRFSLSILTWYRLKHLQTVHLKQLAQSCKQLDETWQSYNQNS